MIHTGLSLWQRATLHSAIVRKAGAYGKQPYRAVARLRATNGDYYRRPPALANSFPKSGTHLLLQIVRGFAPFYYGSYLASMPSVTFRERSLESHLRLIGRIAPWEALPGHLFFDKAYADALSRKNVAHFFIYRDPRDVAISDAHYLTHMNRWHRLHGHFARALQTEEDRVSAAILGVREPSYPFNYPNIAERFARYQSWLGRPDVFAVRFEDLRSPRCAEIVRQMAQFYAKFSADDVNVDTIARKALTLVDASRSHTFRKGEAGGWRRAMSDRHLAEMEHVAGPLLRDLGYG